MMPFLSGFAAGFIIGVIATVTFCRVILVHVAMTQVMPFVFASSACGRNFAYLLIHNAESPLC
jgi:hypothetical protein